MPADQCATLFAQTPFLPDQADRPLAANTVLIGEVGLSGELRAAAQMERRLQEAARLGFTTCIVPKNGPKYTVPEGLRLVKAATLREAVNGGLD